MAHDEKVMVELTLAELSTLRTVMCLEAGRQLKEVGKVGTEHEKQARVRMFDFCTNLHRKLRQLWDANYWQKDPEASAFKVPRVPNEDMSSAEVMRKARQHYLVGKGW